VNRLDAPPLVADPELVTPEWLTWVLRHGGAIGDGTRVSAFDSASIGSGQVGDNVRYALAYDGDPGPASVVCKFSSRDPQSASTGVATLTYETEVAFYRDLAHTVDVSRPHCYLAALETGTANVVIVMEDLAPAEQGDQIIGCSVEQATLAVDEAVRLHGPRWGDPALKELTWLDRSTTQGGLTSVMATMWGGFVDRYRATLDDVTIEAGSQLVASVDRLGEHTPKALTAIHYDYRLDNMLFHPDPTSVRPLAIVDWQTAQLGLGAADVAYFLGNAFDAEVRRGCEESLVRRYHDGLLGYGVTGYSLEECWDDYRRSSYSSLIMAILASMVVERTDRGDAMFMAMANRSAQMAVDLEAHALITS
jgi:hypothetical protein